MDIAITGAAYQHQSQDVNFQRCVNMYPVPPGPEGRGKAALVPTSGLTQLVDLGGNEVRAVYAFDDFVYAVVDSTFYKVTVNHITRVTSSSNEGTLSTSTGKVSMIENPTQILIVDGTSTGYIFTKSTDTFTTITDTDFTGSNSAVFLDGYFICHRPDTGIMQTSAGNDGTSWDALDVATAESGPDDIVGLSSSKGELWVFGESTTEVWYDAANPTGFPLSPRVGLEIQIGCQAPDSIAQIDDFIMWVDDRGFIVKSGVSSYQRDNNSAYQVEILSTDAMNYELSLYTTLADAIGMSYSDRGNLMYQITFPNEKKTWVYNYTTKAWYERTYYNEDSEVEEHHLVQYTDKYKSLDIAGGSRSGILYIMDNEGFTDNGVPIRRKRVTTHSQNEFKLIGVDNLEIRMESKALASGAGSDPQISMKYSNNGGHTFSNLMARSSGKIGEYAKRIRWNRLGIGSEWVFEFSFVEPIAFSIISGAVQITEIEE